MKSHPRLSVSYLLIAIALAVVMSVTANAQNPIPGRNVNMASGTEWPGGDPFLQRQNEPSIAVSTRSPLHLLAGANDYRTVDLPGLPDGAVVGDSWLGLFKSFDGGQTWRSTLLPGYPQDRSPEGLASPLKGFAAGADPTVRAGANGLFYYSGIVFNRGDNALGAVFVARFIDINNKENGDTIKYVNTSVIDSGNSGKFIDKPWLATDIPRASARIATISVPKDGGGALTQSFPAGNVYITYSILLGSGDNIHTQIMFARSTDGGATWSRPMKLSESNAINQGTTIAIDPGTGAVYVAWRRFNNNQESDAILIARSVDGGQTFTKAVEVATISPLDQGTLSPIRFRMNSYPAIAIDGDSNNPSSPGRVYMAWSQRGVGPGANPAQGTPGDTRIVLTTSAEGINWTPPIVVDNNAASPNNPANPMGRGHQLMPAMTFVSGKLVLVYYDLREDSTVGVFTPTSILGSIFNVWAQLFESREPKGDLNPPPGQPEKVFTPTVADVAPAGFTPLLRRHTLDVRVAQAIIRPGQPLNFTYERVSQYVFGSRPGSSKIEQLQINPPNFPMFQLGTTPFIGDYIDIAGLSMTPIDAGWRFNIAPSDAAGFHVTWTDNRDVRPPRDGDWTKYTPPNSASNTGVSKFDPTQPVPGCNPDYTGTRNQNIYTSQITQGLVVGSLGNSKQLVGFQRGFAIFVKNTTNSIKSFRLTITNQPPGGKASFLQFPAPNFPDPLVQLDVTVAPRSSISRTVFITSVDRRARVPVNVAEISTPGAPGPLPGGLQGAVVLNPDIGNPDIGNVDPSNPDIGNAEVYNPDIGNPDIGNPDIGNPDIGNPDIGNPDIGNIDVANPDIGNPDIGNPDIGNPDIGNPDIGNPDIGNPDIGNGSLTDATWTITNRGNTSAAYNLKLLLNGNMPSGVKLQLIIHRFYTTPVAQGCNLKFQTQNALIANIPNPVFTDPASLGTPDITNPSVNNATLSLAPGDVAKVTLRIVASTKLAAINFLTSSVTPVVVAQAVNTRDAQNGIKQPPLTLTIITTSPSLPAITYGSPYNAALQAIGGNPGTARTWNVSSGSLPPGLSLNSNTGQISGTPTAAGIFNLTVQVQDSGSLQHIATRSLTINVAKAALTVTADNKSKFFGDPLPAFTASYSGFVFGDTATTPGVIRGALVFSTTATAASPVGTYPVTPGGISASNYTITFVPGQLTVLSRGTTLSITPPPNVQYSDTVTLQATVGSVALPGQTLTGSVEFFVNGTSVGTGPVNAGGVATLNPPAVIKLMPGNYNVTATFTSTNPNFPSSSGTPVTLTVTPEDARATYTGSLFVNTSCATCGTATVTLSATIQDISAVTGDPAHDPNAGDVRNALVTFINRDTNTPIATVPVNLANASDTKTGSASFNWNVDIGQADSNTFTVGIVVGNYYQRNSSSDNVVITVSKPFASNHITGGGYLTLSNSAGLKAGDPGTKSNFGFHVKKSGNKFEGRINVIVRRSESEGGHHVYQITGSIITSLVVQGSKATFNGNVIIRDITNPLNPTSVDSNGTVQVTLTDNGEPGSSDMIGITVRNNSNALWFSSNWDGNKTVEQKLGGGNLVVR